MTIRGLNPKVQRAPHKLTSQRKAIAWAEEVAEMTGARLLAISSRRYTPYQAGRAGRTSPKHKKSPSILDAKAWIICWQAKNRVFWGAMRTDGTVDGLSFCVSESNEPGKHPDRRFPHIETEWRGTHWYDSQARTASLRDAFIMSMYPQGRGLPVSSSSATLITPGEIARTITPASKRLIVVNETKFTQRLCERYK